MAEFIIRLDDYSLKQFDLLVGSRNRTKTIVSFIKNFVNNKDNDDNEFILIKKVELLKQEKRIKDEEFNKALSQLNSIQEKKRNEELKKIEEQQKESDELDKNNLMLTEALLRNNPLRFRR